jgi:phosphate transport system permease protein
MSAVVIPMKKADSSSRAFKPAGESWVWFTSMGLGIGLTMIVFLLGMIIYNGLEVFWPKPVVRVELKAGSTAGINAASTFAGEIIKSQTKRTAVIDPEGNAQPEQRELQLFVGNKDLYGFSFKYVDRQEIATMEYPADVIVAERLEYGNAIFIPKQLKLADGTIIPASAESFRSALNAVIAEGEERRRTIRRIEREEIGELNWEIEDIRLRRRALETKSSRPADYNELMAEFEARGASLQARYEVLAAEAKELRARQRAAELSYATVDGAATTIPAGEVLGYYFPNQLTFFSKLGQFAHRFWTFLSDEPREANTEGGIFPAIFGTFVMTLLMSVVVTPFGVLAAIYLREYAKQGFLVRCVRIAVNNLAGVPSIVFGVFGLGFFVYVVGGSIDRLFFSLSLPTPTFGTGGVLWASLTLALMTVPVVIVATEEALASVSRGTREGSLACGASKWQTIQRIILPASLPGILTGLILAMARGAGEVAPLMLVGVVKLAPTLPLDTIYPFVHLERKFMHLGFHIYDLGFQSPDSEAAKPMVFATTFLLILLVMILNLGAIVIRNRLRKKYRVSTF